MKIIFQAHQNVHSFENFLEYRQRIPPISTKLNTTTATATTSTITGLFNLSFSKKYNRNSYHKAVSLEGRYRPTTQANTYPRNTWRSPPDFNPDRGAHSTGGKYAPRSARRRLSPGRRGRETVFN